MVTLLPFSAAFWRDAITSCLFENLLYLYMFSTGMSIVHVGSIFLIQRFGSVLLETLLPFALLERGIQQWRVSPPVLFVTWVLLIFGLYWQHTFIAFVTAALATSLLLRYMHAYHAGDQAAASTVYSMSGGTIGHGAAFAILMVHDMLRIPFLWLVNIVSLTCGAILFLLAIKPRIIPKKEALPEPAPIQVDTAKAVIRQKKRGRGRPRQRSAPIRRGASTGHKGMEEEAPDFLKTLAVDPSVVVFSSLQGASTFLQAAFIPLMIFMNDDVSLVWLPVIQLLKQAIEVYFKPLSTLIKEDGVSYMAVSMAAAIGCSFLIDYGLMAHAAAGPWVLVFIYFLHHTAHAKLSLMPWLLKTHSHDRCNCHFRKSHIHRSLYIAESIVCILVLWLLVPLLAAINQETDIFGVTRAVVLMDIVSMTYALISAFQYLL